MRRFKPRVSARTQDKLFLELNAAPGPHAVGVTGAGDYAELFGRNWLAVIEEETSEDDKTIGTLRAYQEHEPGDWRLVTADLPPVFGTVIPGDVRRVSLAFDQAARAVIAYEQNNMIYVTAWSGVSQSYELRSFAGFNPALLMDATINGVIPGSDVIVFYQPANPHREVRARIQRDNYTIAYPIATHPSSIILDRAEAAGLRYTLLSSDERGNPLRNGAGYLVGYASSLAPYPITDKLEGKVSVAGRYEPGLINYATDQLEGSVSVSGVYVLQRQQFEASPITDQLEGSVSLLPGRYDQKRASYAADPTTDELEGSVSMLPGSYRQTRAYYTADAAADALSGTVTIKGVYRES